MSATGSHAGLDEVISLIERFPESREGDYVSYVDEDDPDSGVALRRADGTLVAAMSTETYEVFRGRFKKQTEASHGAPIEITDGTVITSTHSPGAVRYVWRANAASEGHVVVVPAPASTGSFVPYNPTGQRIMLDGNRHARRKAAALHRRRR